MSIRLDYILSRFASGRSRLVLLLVPAVFCLLFLATIAKSFPADNKQIAVVDKRTRVDDKDTNADLVVKSAEEETLDKVKILTDDDETKLIDDDKNKKNGENDVKVDATGGTEDLNEKVLPKENYENSQNLPNAEIGMGGSDKKKAAATETTAAEEQEERNKLGTDEVAPTEIDDNVTEKPKETPAGDSEVLMAPKVNIQPEENPGETMKSEEPTKITNTHDDQENTEPNKNKDNGAESDSSSNDQTTQEPEKKDDLIQQPAEIETTEGGAKDTKKTNKAIEAIAGKLKRSEIPTSKAADTTETSEGALNALKESNTETLPPPRITLEEVLMNAMKVMSEKKGSKPGYKEDSTTEKVDTVEPISEKGEVTEDQ